MIKAIFIEAGHGLGVTGAIDNGAAALGTDERREAVEIAQETIDLLKLNPAFDLIEIIPVGISERMRLIQKVNFVNAACKDKGIRREEAVLVSVHINAGGGAGVEGWYKYGDGPSESFGMTIIKELATAIAKGGVGQYHGKAIKPDILNRWGRLAIVRDTMPVAVLVECGFIDNPKEAAKLKDPDADNVFAQGIVKGLMRHMGIDPATDDEAVLSKKKPSPWAKGWWAEASRRGMIDAASNPHDTPTKEQIAKMILAGLGYKP
jgi:N-acetylmuramoyl-L-alanine amidase